MLAIAKTRPGKGLQLVEREPLPVSANEVLVKVKACGICGSDVNIYLWNEAMATSLTPHLPVVIGHELAGEVVKTGEHAHGFHVGDRVMIEPFISCGRCYYCVQGRSNLCEKREILCKHRPGGMAEYITAPEQCLFRLPDNLSYAEGALMETLGVAVHGLERMPVMAGNSVAIMGPGPIGLFLMQVLKAAGASPLVVIGTSRSPKRLEIARSLKADATLVADMDDIGARVREMTGGLGVDQVFETAGTGTGLRQAFDIVRKGGEICSLGATDDPLVIKPFHTMRSKEINLINASGRTASTWRRATSLVATGKVDLSKIIDRKVPLKDAIAAFELLVRDRNVMKVVLEP